MNAIERLIEAAKGASMYFDNLGLLTEEQQSIMDSLDEAIAAIEAEYIG